MAGLLTLVYRTKLGIAMRATSQNRQVAGLMGININTVIALTFVIGAGLGAVAGVMVGTYYGIAHYQMGFMLGLKAFSAAVLGGIGNLAGAMLGGMLLGVIEALGAGYVGDLTNLCQLANWSDALAQRCVDNPHLTLFGSNYQDVFAFLVLIAGARFPAVRTARRARQRPRVRTTAMQRFLNHQEIPARSPGSASRSSQSRCSCLPFALAGIGTAWVRITNLAILYVLLALGLNIVVGFAGLLDLGYIAFYAVGAYVYALLASPALQPAPAVLDHPADRRGSRVHVRRAARRADAQAARRLSRHRHARLR